VLIENPADWQTVAMSNFSQGAAAQVPQAAEGSARADLVDEVENAARGLLGVSIKAMSAVEPTSPTQLRALMLLQAIGPTKLSVLAERLGVAASSASRLVDRLAAAGHVERTVPAHSRREVQLELTRAGTRLVRRHDKARRLAFANLLTAIEPADREALLRGLRAVSRVAADSAPRDESPG